MSNSNKNINMIKHKPRTGTGTRTRTKKRNYNPHALSIKSEIIFNILMALFSLACILPFIFTVIISFTDDNTLINNGYSFFPKKLSLEGYAFIFKTGSLLLNSYMVSIYLTIIGTLLSLALTTTYAYVLFRKNFKFRCFFNVVAVFTMLFSSGLVPFYVVITQFLNLSDNLWAIILPGCLNAFNIIVFRTFLSTTVHESIIESAIVDGCGEFGTYIKIAMPLCLPGIATIGLFSCIGYWNEWFNALLFINDPNKIPIQYLLYKVQNILDFLVRYSGTLNAAEMEQALNSIPRESSRMVMSVLIVLPIACAYPFFQKYFVKGLTVGSIKG